MKLDVAGNILFRITFGGKGGDHAEALALDPIGNILIVGATNRVDFPLSGAIQTQRGFPFGVSRVRTGLLLKLSPEGDQILASTYFGGSHGTSVLNAVAADLAGNIYVAGSTNYFPAQK